MKIQKQVSAFTTVVEQFSTQAVGLLLQKGSMFEGPAIFFGTTMQRKTPTRRDRIHLSVPKRKRWTFVEDGEKHSVIWRMIISVTLESPVFMGKNYLDNLHSIKITEDLTMKQMFGHVLEFENRTIRRDPRSEYN